MVSYLKYFIKYTYINITELFIYLCYKNMHNKKYCICHLYICLCTLEYSGMILICRQSGGIRLNDIETIFKKLSNIFTTKLLLFLLQNFEKKK